MGSIVYFIQQGHENFFKIGRTDAAAETRMKELQTGNPKRLRVFGIIECNGNMQISEAKLHDEFDAYRVNGEWFFVSPKRIVEVLNEYSGKIFVEDPFSVEFIKGKDRTLVIEKHTGINEFDFKLAKARAIKTRKMMAGILTVIISIPIALGISSLAAGFIFMIYSTGSNVNGFEFNVFFKALKIFFPIIYITSFCVRILNDLKIDDAPQDEVLLEYDKIRAKGQ